MFAVLAQLLVFSSNTHPMKRAWEAPAVPGEDVSSSPASKSQHIAIYEEAQKDTVQESSVAAVLSDEHLLLLILMFADGRDLVFRLPLVCTTWYRLTRLHGAGVEDNTTIARRVWESFLKPIVEARLLREPEADPVGKMPERDKAMYYGGMGLNTGINNTEEWMLYMGGACLRYWVYPDGIFSTVKLRRKGMKNKEEEGMQRHDWGLLCKLHLMLESICARLQFCGRLWMARNCNFGAPCHEDFPIVPIVMYVCLLFISPSLMFTRCCAALFSLTDALYF